MQISGGILFAAAAAVAAAGAALRLGGLALGLDACFIGMERALGDVAESGDALVDHIPQAHGQVVAVAAVDGHAFEAVAVMAAGLLAGAVVAGLTHLTQEFQLDFKRLVLKALWSSSFCRMASSFPSIFIVIRLIFFLAPPESGTAARYSVFQE